MTTQGSYKTKLTSTQFGLLGKIAPKWRSDTHQIGPHYKFELHV